MFAYLILPAVAVIAMLFGAIQAYYSRAEQMAQSAKDQQSANRAVEDAGNVVLAATRLSLPLPSSVSRGLEEARDVISSAWKAGADPNRCRELTGLTDALLLRHDKAEPELSALIQEQPERLLAYLGLGISFFSREKYDDSIGLLTSGLQKFPLAADLTGHRAKAFLRQKKLDLAFEDARSAVIQQPESAFSHFVLGLVLLAQRLDGQATDAFSAASRLDPAWHEARLAIASMHIKERRFDRALRNVEAAIAIVPEDATAHLARAALLNALGDEEAAHIAIGEAQDLMPVQYLWHFGGYTRFGVWASDLPALDELNGKFIVEYLDTHPRWNADGFELPLLKAMGATQSVDLFLRLEDALYEVCVTPIYHPDTEFGSSQIVRQVNLTPSCFLRKRKLEVIVMEENRFALSPDELPRRPQPEVDTERIKAWDTTP